jgi:predicted permease
VTAARPLQAAIVVLTSLLIALIGAWAQDHNRGSVTAILATAGAGFVSTASLGLAVLAYLAGS